MARPPVYLSESDDDAHEIIGTAEAAVILGCSTTRVKQLRQIHDDFPPTIARLSMAGAHAWYREDVEAWAALNADRRARHARKEVPA